MTNSRTTEGEIAQRWPLILASCIGIISSSFVLPIYTIGALVVPVTQEFGWSRAEFQAAILFSSGLGALTSPFVGWLNDRFGPRRVALPRQLQRLRRPCKASASGITCPTGAPRAAVTLHGLSRVGNRDCYVDRFGRGCTD